MVPPHTASTASTRPSRRFILHPVSGAVSTECGAWGGLANVDQEEMRLVHAYTHTSQPSEANKNALNRSEAARGACKPQQEAQQGRAEDCFRHCMQTLGSFPGNRPRFAGKLHLLPATHQPPRVPCCQARR